MPSSSYADDDSLGFFAQSPDEDVQRGDDDAFHEATDDFPDQTFEDGGDDSDDWPPALAAGEELSELGVPNLNLIFDERNDAVAYAKAWAPSHGFLISLHKTSSSTRGRLQCHRGGESTVKDTYSPRRIHCPFMLTVYQWKSDNKWHFKVTRSGHNHVATPSEKIDAIARRKKLLPDQPDSITTAVLLDELRRAALDQTHHWIEFLRTRSAEEQAVAFQDFRLMRERAMVIFRARENLTLLDDQNVQSNGQHALKKARLTVAPKTYKCGLCNEVGHNKQTCELAANGSNAG